MRSSTAFKYGLTKREREVLQLMINGAQSKQIACRLSVSGSTIRAHQRSIFEKLHVSSDIEAVVKTFQERLFDDTTIVRNIEFAPEHFQAGMAILSYFGTVLRQKHPYNNATVRIEQDGLAVRLVIVSPDNETEIIEKTLNDYGLVMSGRMPPSEYLVDPQDIMQLENKLELANFELRCAQRQIDFEREGYRQRIHSLDEEVRWLRKRLGLLLSNGSSESTTDIMEILRGFSTQSNASLNEAFAILERALSHESDSEHLQEIHSALTTIKDQNPRLLDRLKNFSVHAASSTAGRSLHDLIMQIQL